ncbi:hypothetical protein ACIPMW_19495 [Streptomyces sp. NPDC086669]|uniref:hypothetical protein n=1 Tax=Streptomyces sp. NPDC086669 TaxID=3365753 RepID=UPI0037FEF1AE
MPADFPEATRASYDTIAAAYAERFPNRPADGHPLDRALIGAFAELARASGDSAGRMRLSERFGRDVDLTCHWRTPEAVAAALAEAGLRVTARTLREPVGEERRPRAFLLAERPAELTPR